MCEEILLFDVIDFYYHLQIVSRKYYLTMVSFLMRKSISTLVTSIMIYVFSFSLVPLTRSY